MQQQHVKKADAFGVHAGRRKRVEVKAAHLHIFHAAAQQRARRADAGRGGALRANHRVKLVFNLQNVGVQLQVFAAVFDAEFFVLRMRRANRAAQRGDESLQTVVVNADAGLRAAAVSEPAEAQRGRVRRVKTVRVVFFKIVFAPLRKRLAHRRRRAEQITRQPRMPVEVANQREVMPRLALLQLLRVTAVRKRAPKIILQRKIKMNAGDGLHHAAVAHAQAAAVGLFHFCDVGVSIPRDLNALLLLHDARHAVHPQILFADVVVDEVVNVAEFAEQFAGAGAHRRDQFQQRLGVIGGDGRMRQRRPQRRRMRRLRQHSVFVYAQTFLLYAAPQPRESGGGAARAQLSEDVGGVSAHCKRPAREWGRAEECAARARGAARNPTAFFAYNQRRPPPEKLRSPRRPPRP